MVKMQQTEKKLESWQLEYQGFFKRVNDPPTDYIEIFVSDWNKDHWAFYVFIDVEDYESDIEAITDLISTDRLNFRDGDFYVELIDHSGQDKTRDIYQAFLDKAGLDHNSVIWAENWEEVIEEIESRPPKFSDFDSAWDCFEHMEQFYSKDSMYDKLVSWLGTDDIRLMYERFNQGLF